MLHETPICLMIKSSKIHGCYNLNFLSRCWNPNEFKEMVCNLIFFPRCSKPNGFQQYQTYSNISTSEVSALSTAGSLALLAAPRPRCRRMQPFLETRPQEPCKTVLRCKGQTFSDCRSQILRWKNQQKITKIKTKKFWDVFRYRYNSDLCLRTENRARETRIFDDRGGVGWGGARCYRHVNICKSLMLRYWDLL